MASNRRRYDKNSAMSAGVDYLLRQQGRLKPNPGLGTASGVADDSTIPIEPTFLVAAFDARTAIRNVADFRCSGTNDEVEIQLALDALPIGSRGKVQLTEGTFRIQVPPSSQAIFIATYNHLQGIGHSTVLEMTNDESALNDGINMGVESQLSDMTIDISNSSDGKLSAVFCGGARCTIKGIRFLGMKHIDLDDIYYINGGWQMLVHNCDFYDLGSQVHGGG